MLIGYLSIVQCSAVQCSAVQCSAVCYVAVGKYMKELKRADHVQKIMAKKTGMKDRNKGRL